MKGSLAFVRFGTGVLLLSTVCADAPMPVDIGSRRELLVDRHLIERLDGVRLALHRPVRREIVFRTDAP